MNWKELQIDNLPPDILTGDYEFEWNRLNHGWRKPDHYEKPLEILKAYMDSDEIEYRYRKPEPEAPTHEEIWNKAWKHDNGVWFRVLQYQEGKYLIGEAPDDWVPKSYFIGKQSADIPEES